MTTPIKAALDAVQWIRMFVNKHTDNDFANQRIDQIEQHIAALESRPDPAHGKVEVESVRPALMMWHLGYDKTDNGVIMDALDHLETRGITLTATPEGKAFLDGFATRYDIKEK